MDDGPRFFTVEEANGLVAALEIEFGRIARARAEIAPLLERLGGADASVALLNEERAPERGREAEAARLRVLAGEITSAVERINELGGLVKDLELGLVDFYALRDGEPVFLCWQFGERAIAHWHGLDEGYGGRRPLEGAAASPPDYLN